jgi:glutamate dehydrogenase
VRYLLSSSRLFANGMFRLNADPRICFEKYVDAIIDLLIPGTSPGIKEPIVDLYGKPELLFLGPDG